MLLRQLLRLSRTARVHSIRYFLFSSSTPKLSASAQQAVWATAIIRRIINSQDHRPKDFDSKTLSQLIEDMQPPKAKGYQTFDDENKEQVLRMFKTGISLNSDIYKQERVVKAKASGSHLTKFFPNFIVTPQVFKSLYHMEIGSLIYGGFGISKTFSLIYYKVLSEYITKFWMQGRRDQSKKRQKENLIEQCLLNRDCYKYWYWTLDADFIDQIKQENDDIQNVLNRTVRDILLQQAFQLTQDEKRELMQITSFKDFRQKLTSHYKSQTIQSRAIIDQINALASKMRQCNAILLTRLEQEAEIKKQKKQFLKKYPIEPTGSQAQKNDYKKIKKQIDQKEQQSKEKYQKSPFYKWMEPTEKLLSLVKAFRRLGFSYVFNSSLNIQLDLLTQSQKPQLFSFNVRPNSHKQFDQYYIRYQQQLNEKWAIIDFWKFFQTEFSKRLDDAQLSESLKNKFKTELRNMLQNQPIHTYYRPLYTRQFLQIAPLSKEKGKAISPILKQFIDKKNSFLQMVYAAKLEQAKLVQALGQLLKMFKEYCRLRCVEGIRRFIDKGTQEQIIAKGKFIQFLYFVSLLYSNTKARKQRLRLNTKSFITLFKLNDCDINKFLHSRLHNKEFLDVVFGTTHIQFAWTAEQFVQICQSVVYKNLDEFISQFWTQAGKQLLYRNPKTLGNIFQDYLVEALRQGSQLRLQIKRKQTKLKDQTSENDSGIDVLGGACFKIKGAAAFKPYNLNYQGNKINDKLHNLQQLKDAADKNPNEFFVGKPVYKNKPDFNSKAIDFMILRRLKEVEDSYQLYLFDATTSFTSMDKHNGQNKDFLKDIQQSFDKKKLKCNIKYVVICFNKFLLSQQIYQNKNLIQLTCGSIESMYVSSPDHDRALQFRIIQKLAINLNQQNQSGTLTNKVEQQTKL